jgi:hypothetical protein
MRRVLIAAAMLAGATLPAAAFAGTYYVRNDSPRAQSCGIRRPSTQVMVRVIIPRGGEWRQTYERDEGRVLVCYTGPNRNTFLLEAGQRYSLREDGDGILRLRTLGRD